jgi:hypothetical protein
MSPMLKPQDLRTKLFNEYMIKLKTSVTQKVQDIDYFKGEKVQDIDYPVHGINNLIPFN